jgi:hypothetical protein
MPKKEHEEAIMEMASQLAICQNMLTKLAVMFAKFQEDTGSPMSGKSQPATNIRSLQLWSEHLAEHGPTFRQDIWDATGLNLAQAGHNQVRKWVGPMAFWPDNALSPDAVLSIQSLGTGKGRPPVIYFLWKQRYDVRPKYGVGPERPADGEDGSALLGVVQPEPTEDRGFNYVSDTFADATWPEGTPADGKPVIWNDLPDDFPDPDGPTIWDDLPEPADEEVPPYNVEDWKLQHAEVLRLAGQGMKPTPEQFALLRSTHPDGPEAANIAVAMAGRGVTIELD